jgi:hypothetical protein
VSRSGQGQTDDRAENVRCLVLAVVSSMEAKLDEIAETIANGDDDDAAAGRPARPAGAGDP